jgi:hypothetical protein
LKSPCSAATALSTDAAGNADAGGQFGRLLGAQTFLGSTKTLRIFSGVSWATFSISMPPSEEAIIATGLGGAIGQRSNVVLLADVGTLFDQQATDLLADRPGLVRHQLHAEDLAGKLADFVQRLGDLDTSAFATAARVNLGFDHPEIASQGFGCLDRFIDGLTEHPARNGNAEFLQELLTLIFVNFHALSLLELRLRSVTNVTKPRSRQNFLPWLLATVPARVIPLNRVRMRLQRVATIQLIGLMPIIVVVMYVTGEGLQRGSRQKGHQLADMRTTARTTKQSS